MVKMQKKETLCLETGYFLFCLFGQYITDTKISDVNYIVNTPGRRKKVHVTMLKQYIDRDSALVHQLVLLVQSLRNKMK